MRQHRNKFVKYCVAITTVMLFSALITSCEKHDDFDFVGKVIYYEECSMGYGSFGYVIQLTTPDDIGGDYTLGTTTYKNVIVAYGSDRQLYENDNVSGKMYLDPNYSKTSCDYHYNRDCPEAVFTKLKVTK